MATHQRQTVDTILNGMTLVIAAVLLAFGVTNAHRRMLATPGSELTPGRDVRLGDVDWRRNGRTLVFALQPECGPTEAGLPLYRDLLASIADVGIHVVLVTPHPVPVGRRMAKEYALDIADVRQQAFATLDVPGSPTLLLVDGNGRLMRAWIGRLSQGDAYDLFRTLGVARVAAVKGTSPPRSNGRTRLSALGHSGAIILDTRSRDDVARSPIPGALAIPLEELDVRLDHEVPRDRRVIAVCDYCADCGRSEERVLPSRCDVAMEIITGLGFSNVEYAGQVELGAQLGSPSGSR